jgi:Flp pilus assembly protein CpaB
LPGGRAVVGGFLVAVAAVLVFSATLAGSSNPGHPWVVATQPLRAGTVLGPGDLTTQTMRLPGGTAALSYRQAEALIGQALAVAVQPGELLQRSMLAPATTSTTLRPVSVAVDPVSLGGLTPGTPVDVLATTGSASNASGPAGSGASVSVVVRGAVLLDVSHPSSSSLVAPADTSDVTIGVTTLGEVEAVVSAAHTGTITLVAAERSDGVGPGPSGQSSPSGS